MRINDLASYNNLKLAWRRITTGGNVQYKQYYRHLYYTYEIALDQNLKDLRQRLIGGTYNAQKPERIYIPKASGLHFKRIGHPAACRTHNKNGEIIDFGVTLDTNGPFSKNCPSIADCFRIMNKRRNGLPVSHPYEKKTALQSLYLKRRERDHFVTLLQNTYKDIMALIL